MPTHVKVYFAFLTVAIGALIVVMGLTGQPKRPTCKPGFVLMRGYDGVPFCVLGLPPGETQR